MDKKNILLGVIFLAAGLGLMSWNTIQQTKAKQAQLLQEAERNEQALAQSDIGQSPSPASQKALPEIVGEPSLPSPIKKVIKTVAEVDRPEELVQTIENDFIKVTLSSYGGAIKTVMLKKYPAENPNTVENPRPTVLNKVSDVPALALNRAVGNDLMPFINFYELESATADSVVFTKTTTEGIKIRRSYSVTDDVEGPAPYLIRHKTEFLNNSADIITLDKVFFNLGTAAPSEADYMGFNLNASYYNNGDYETIPAKKFAGGGFIFKSEPKDRIEERGIMQWGAVKNQFFTTIFTPDTAAQAMVARGIQFPADPTTGKIPTGITASLEFSLPTLQPNSGEAISGDFFVGPKDFDRLAQMGLNQDNVMQLSWFMGFFVGLIGFVAKTLLTLLSGIYNLLGNWGFAIILTTIVIRLLLWPLTAKAARASKRMQKLQKPLKEIQEKYRDNPQKLNQEMMHLWKKHKINPLSGCWPVMIQFPIFIAFFNLLRNSSDLRFADFLWINDLSMPDATISLGATTLPFVGSTINVLPFVWIISMHFQMKMMPQPSIDNSGAKMIKYMPFIFFPFTYFFSSGLVLYWTATNCFSIFQQWITNRTRDAEDEAIEVEIAEMESKKTNKVLLGPLISKKKKKKNKDQR